MEQQQELIECPYDHHHKVRPDRIEAHVMKCQYKQSHLDKGFVICPFNFKHHMPKSEYDNHALTCPDRKELKVRSQVNNEVNHEKQDAVMQYLSTKQLTAQSELSEQDTFPLGVMEGDFGGAKYSRGRGSWRRPRK